MIELERLSDYVLDSINTGVMVVDLTSHVAFLNREAEETLGVPAETLLGAPIVGDDRFLPFVVLINDHRTRDPALGASRRQVSAEYTRPDGRVLPLGFTISNLVDGSRTVLGYVIVFRDLTEIQRLREQARRSETLAALGTMAAGVAHEIRNPLHAIRAAAELCEVKAQLGKPVDDYVKIVFQEVARLDELIEDILQYGGEPRLAKRPTAPNRVVEASLALARIPPGIRVETRLAGDLPEVSMDPDRIMQVLMNLVVNACQAQPQGGEVVVSTRRVGCRELPGRSSDQVLDAIEFRVADRGGGIAEADLASLFRPFFTRRKGGGGTGLGLAICQKLVEAHGGSIVVESKVGEGAVFKVYLPVTVADLSLPPRRPGSSS